MCHDSMRDQSEIAMAIRFGLKVVNLKRNVFVVHQNSTGSEPRTEKGNIIMLAVFFSK